MASMARWAAGEVNRACWYRGPEWPRGRAEGLRRDVSQLSLEMAHRAVTELAKLVRLLASGDVEQLRAPLATSSVPSPIAPAVAIREQVVQEQQVRSAVGHQVRERPDQAPAGAAVPDHGHPQRPVVLEVEPLQRPAVHQIGRVGRDVRRFGLIGKGKDFQTQMPRGGGVLSQPARAVGVQSHPQRGMPAHQAAQPIRGVRHRAALGQVQPSAHGELVAAGPHVLQDGLFAPGQRLGSGLRSGELDVQSILADPPEHIQRHRTCRPPCGCAAQTRARRQPSDRADLASTISNLRA
jgi:hypothetical protein